MSTAAERAKARRAVREAEQAAEIAITGEAAWDLKRLKESVEYFIELEEKGIDWHQYLRPDYVEAFQHSLKTLRVIDLAVKAKLHTDHKM